MIVGMFRPQFSLRTLFVLITAISIPMTWFAYHLQWKRKRDEFQNTYHCGLLMMYTPDNTPWPLKLLGAKQADYLLNVPNDHIKEAKNLFPESIINPTQEDYNRETQRRSALISN